MEYIIISIFVVAIGFYLFRRYGKRDDSDVSEYVSVGQPYDKNRTDRKNISSNILSSIIQIAEKGVNHFELKLSKEGQLELLMFDIWFGIQALESRDIYLDNDSTHNRIEEYLTKKIADWGLPSEKNERRKP